MPIRVLHVVTHMNRGGLETMIMNYYRQVDRERVQFDFLVHREREAAYDAEILALGGRIHRLPPLNPLSRGYLAALDAFFKEHPEYRIVHCHLDCMASVPLKAARKHGVPIRIAHAHSSNQTRDAKYLMKLFYKRKITQYATRLFACGREAGTWMFGTDDFTVLNNAIDTRRYLYSPETARQVRQSLGIPERAFVVGHVGNFTPPKNHGFILEVFEALLKKVPDARLVLAGDGQLRPENEARAEALGIREQVLFLGLRTDVDRLLQGMDVFLFPSLYEGLPVSMVEAQAAGLPCLISDKVPIQCRMTDTVWQFPLSEAPERWAERLLELRQIPRKHALEQIQRAGFDIRENAQWLQNFYLGAEV